MGRTAGLLNPVLPEARWLAAMTLLNRMFSQGATALSGSHDEVPVREVVRRIAPCPMLSIAAGHELLEPA